MVQRKKHTYERARWYVVCLMVLLCTSFSHALSAAQVPNMGGQGITTDGNHCLRQNNRNISIEENNMVPPLVTSEVTGLVPSANNVTNEDKKSSIPIVLSKKTRKQQSAPTLSKTEILLQQRLKGQNICHQNQRNFACHACGKSFATRSGLTRHIKGVHIKERLYQCTRCQKGFLHKINLKRHMLEHAGVRPYVCSLCHTSFTRKENFKRHLQHFHASNKLFVCIVCDKRYARRANLIRHQKSAHVQENRYECLQCVRFFTSRAALIRHIQQVHTKNQRFACTVCDKSYTQKKNLIRHQKSAHV